MALVGVWIVWNLEPLASGCQSGPKLIPHVICQVLHAWEKNSERGLILEGIKCQVAPSSHVRKIKSRFGILVNLPSQLYKVPCVIPQILSLRWMFKSVRKKRKQQSQFGQVTRETSALAQIYVLQKNYKKIMNSILTCPDCCLYIIPLLYSFISCVHVII